MPPEHFHSFRFSFRVSTSITLHELGFYGPFDKIKASYFIHIEIFKPNESGQMLPNSWDSSRVLKLKTNVLAEKDEIFFVNLGEGVSIEPCTWYLVQFMLDVSFCSHSHFKFFETKPKFKIINNCPVPRDRTRSNVKPPTAL